MLKEEFEEMIGIKVSNEMYYGILDPMYRAVPALREKGFCELLSTDGIKTLDDEMQKIEMSEMAEWGGTVDLNTDDGHDDLDSSDDFFNQEELDQLILDTPLDLDEAMEDLARRRNDLPF